MKEQASLKEISLGTALDKLCSLLSAWGLESEDYVLVDEFAYLLQGYEVKATEVESKHLDVYVNLQKLPWKDKKERSIIPPKDSREMDDWIKFMKETGYSLDMLRAESQILAIPSVVYSLPSGGYLRLMRAYEMTEAFIKLTLMHYSLLDVGKEKIREWLAKLELIQKAAEKKGDKKTARLCQDKLVECQKRWQEVF